MSDFVGKCVKAVCQAMNEAPDDAPAVETLVRTTIATVLDDLEREITEAAQVDLEFLGLIDAKRKELGL